MAAMPPIESLYRCMQRCTPYTPRAETSAQLSRCSSRAASSRMFNRASNALRWGHGQAQIVQEDLGQIQVVLAPATTGSAKNTLKSSKKGKRRSKKGDSTGHWNPNTSVALNPCSVTCDAPKAYDARRRDPRVNGSDIYVVRVLKNGMGSARPCGRCLEWCSWAGVKRIFHWNEVDNRFDVVKVSAYRTEIYQTHADERMAMGTVSCLVFLFDLCRN